MDRRRFIGTVGTGAAALAALALPGRARGQACGAPTEADNYGTGPFYTPDAPARVHLASEFEPGQRIAISGTVSDCSGPIRAAGLDVWHATDSGCYQHPNDTCPDVPGHPETFRLRGKVITDAQGRYAFDSILPGAYLNGSRYRPRHIHVIITHSSLSADLVTQLYFQGDPYIPGDFGADAANAANRIIPLIKTVPALWKGTWDIRLPTAVTGAGRAHGSRFADSDFTGFDLAVRREGERFLIGLPARESRPVELRLYGSDGALVERSLHAETPLAVETAGLAPGAYPTEFRWRTAAGLRMESVTLRK